MSRFKRLEISNEDSEVSLNSNQNSLKNDWFRQAGDARRSGQYESALRLYSRSLEADKSLVPAWCGQVQMLIFLEEYPEAELWSRKAIELFPGSGVLVASHAHALCRQNKKSDSLAAIDKAIAMTGESAYRWTVRGEVLTAKRQNLASVCFDKARLVDPDWLTSAEIGLILLHYSQPSRALMSFRTAVEQGADAHYAWYLKGLAEHRLGMTSKARESFQTTLELSPQHSDSQNRLRELDQGEGTIWNRLRRLWN